MPKILHLLAVAALAAAAHAAPVLAEGDAAKGEKIFNRKACHKVGDGAKNGVGPILNNVVGRPAGTVDGFSYSQMNKTAGANGLVWDETLMLAYLADPNGFLKQFLTDKGQLGAGLGATKMLFKLPKEDERKNVIAYLKKFSKAP